MRNISENPWLRSLAVCLLSFSILLITGCNGCRNEKDDDPIAKKKEDEKEKKRKADFETRTPIMLPGIFRKKKKTKEEIEKEKGKLNKLDIAQMFDDPAIRNNRAKLGHWHTVNFQAIANNYNADGQLTAFSIDGMSRPVNIPATDYFVSTTRPVSLPKGEWKNFETTVFVPRREIKTSQVNINYLMQRSTSGLNQIMLPQPTAAMRDFQNHIILMSNRADTYKYLEMTDNIKLRSQTGMGTAVPPFYYVIPTNPQDPLPLPRHALSWTTIAYVIWDDYDPNIISVEHQEALLDWLHFGGQLILSGPDCLDKLQNSFLADYLPAHFDGSRNLSDEDVAELNETWALPSRRGMKEKKLLRISEKVPLLGVTFKPHSDARFVDGTGEIAIERKIGRGRIVATAFSLNAPTVRNWRSIKSFINGALLRKPPRNFGTLNNEDVGFEWIDDGTSCFDPLLNTTLRFISRDLAPNGTNLDGNYILEDDNQNRGMMINNMQVGDSFRLKNRYTKNSGPLNQRALEENSRYYGGFDKTPQSGTCGWNDKSGVAEAARETLKETAGITPPNSGFVLKMLAAYLLVLVPLNWLIFRLMGKVEYAWAAAPLIAIVGAFLVVRMASLDIGFVRSNTQIGILEVHSDYSRGHLTEFSALYTSLSTRYNVELDNVSSQSLPFATTSNVAGFEPRESMSEVKLRRTTDSRLEGFQIQSNSTGLLHSESLLNLGGAFSFSQATEKDAAFVGNASGINLSNAAVLSRKTDGDYQISWIGDLAAGSDTDLIFEDIERKNLGKKWGSIPGFRSTQRASEEIWKKYTDGAKQASLDVLKEIPELKSDWPNYENLFVSLNRDSETPDIVGPGLFYKVYQRINSDSSVGLGRMLDTILNNLTLAKGEYRLVGGTDQRLGGSRFEPASTQTDRQTLVVVHLKHPELPTAKPDYNSFEDFKVLSDLDRERELQEIEQELKEQMEESKLDEESKAKEQPNAKTDQSNEKRKSKALESETKKKSGQESSKESEDDSKYNESKPDSTELDSSATETEDEKDKS